MLASVRAGVLAIGATAASLLLAATAQAENLTYRVFIDGLAEVPANKTAGRGLATIILDTDTKKLIWTIAYQGLTGPATAVNFYGPADETENADIVVPITGPLSSPITGEAILTDEVARLFNEGGQTYVNILTRANPAGEIRGHMGTALERS